MAQCSPLTNHGGGRRATMNGHFQCKQVIAVFAQITCPQCDCVMAPNHFQRQTAALRFAVLKKLLGAKFEDGLGTVCVAWVQDRGWKVRLVWTVWEVLRFQTEAAAVNV